ncbi:carbamoyl-phosphate synthase large subunit [Candidatus Gracilibacteria bacterium]|nr:carbamoyl-phosphate synthase large subunit [Candidatus Gracilibacteria bacterium]
MKILLLGSGALKIGEAGEFDYSGSQAIKAFKANGHEVILLNPNIATVQTDPKLFRKDDLGPDKVYFLPVTVTSVEKVIQKEKPNALALSFGGQTALNCGLELERQGILKKYNIQVMGTPVSVIQATEDREIFKKKLAEIRVLTPRSIASKNISAAKKAAEKIGFPLIIRAGFALGGKGSGFCDDMKIFEEMVREAFAFSPQILVEEDLRGWKEIEYEVVRDGADNAITVVNMENFDPLGIHTGESIVVSPSMTLANTEYQMLRSISLKTIRHLGIIGECNIQFALNPLDDRDYRVIEVNARLSRSSALASKASGYPLAAVAAEIILGKTMPEIPNAITKVTTSFFEPALDYLALKIPRWDLKKFRKVSHTISTEMKSVGEVMALGRNFPECLQKAIRMLAIGSEGILDSPLEFKTKAELEKYIRVPSPSRIFAIGQAFFTKKFSLEKIWSLTKIDRWFLQQIERITDCAHEISSCRRNWPISPTLLKKAKLLGFSDIDIACLIKRKPSDIRTLRKKLKILPVTKQIDTLSAEFPAKTNYLYMTYAGKQDDV